jgi:hypothetical protein
VGGKAGRGADTSIDGKSDVTLPEHVRVYLRRYPAREAAFPPSRGTGQALGNHAQPTSCGLAHATTNGSRLARDRRQRYPQLPAILVSLNAILFLDFRASATRKASRPGQLLNGASRPAVPGASADADNELAGLRTEVSVPLATTTGWNFRAERVGNLSTTYALLGSMFVRGRGRAR